MRGSPEIARRTTPGQRGRSAVGEARVSLGLRHTHASTCPPVIVRSDAVGTTRWLALSMTSAGRECFATSSGTSIRSPTRAFPRRLLPPHPCPIVESRRSWVICVTAFAITAISFAAPAITVVGLPLDRRRGTWWGTLGAGNPLIRSRGSAPPLAASLWGARPSVSADPFHGHLRLGDDRGWIGRGAKWWPAEPASWVRPVCRPAWQFRHQRAALRLRYALVRPAPRHGPGLARQRFVGVRRNLGAVFSRSPRRISAGALRCWVSPRCSSRRVAPAAALTFARRQKSPNRWAIIMARSWELRCWGLNRRWCLRVMHSGLSVLRADGDAARPSGRALRRHGNRPVGKRSDAFRAARLRVRQSPVLGLPPTGSAAPGRSSPGPPARSRR